MNKLNDLQEIFINPPPYHLFYESSQQRSLTVKGFNCKLRAAIYGDCNLHESKKEATKSNKVADEKASGSV